MDSQKQQADDDGIIRIQRLAPDQFDVVLGSPASKRKPGAARKRPPYELYAIILGIVVVSALLVAQLLPRRSAPTPVVELVVAAPVVDTQSEPELTPVAPVAAAVAPLKAPQPSAANPIQLEAYNGPNVVRHPQPVEVQPLDNCLKDGNVIDENVLNCRFGQLPRPERKPVAQGMVSSSYMAELKAEKARSKPVRSTSPAEYSTIAIHEWDGRNRYEAKWRSIDNHVDGASVCANFPAESVERRECRKAAKVFFKEACNDWGIRFRRDHDDASKRMEQRYCEAMGSYEP
jgi:hypothetical protein